MCSPSRSPLPPPSPSAPPRFSQCTRSESLSHASNLGWWSQNRIDFYQMIFFCVDWYDRVNMWFFSLLVCGLHWFLNIELRIFVIIFMYCSIGFFFFLVMSFLGFWGFFLRASLLAQSIKNLPAVQETWVRSLGWEGPLETEMTTHSSILAWKISWTQEPGGLQSMGSQRVGHDWATNINTLHFWFLHQGDS